MGETKNTSPERGLHLSKLPLYVNSFRGSKPSIKDLPIIYHIYIANVE